MLALLLMHQHLVLLLKIKILCALEKVLLCPPPGNKGRLSGYSFSISLLWCLVDQKVTSHVQKSISCKIMSLVGRFSHFCPLQCLSLLCLESVLIQYFAVSGVLISFLQPGVTTTIPVTYWLPLQIAIKFLPLFWDCAWGTQ